MAAEDRLVALLDALDNTAERVDDRTTPMPDEPDAPNYPYRFGYLRAELNETRSVLREYLAEHEAG